jgi:hypothetical protein
MPYARVPRGPPLRLRMHDSATFDHSSPAHDPCTATAYNCNCACAYYLLQRASCPSLALPHLTHVCTLRIIDLTILHTVLIPESRPDDDSDAASISTYRDVDTVPCPLASFPRSPSPALLLRPLVRHPKTPFLLCSPPPVFPTLPFPPGT